MPRTRLRTTLFGLAVASLATASPARADDRVELGGFIGAHLFSSSNELGQPPDGDNTLENSFAFGVRMSYRLVGRLHAEGELALMPAKPEDESTDVMTFGWRAHARYDLTNDRLRPFFLLGAGGMTAAPSDTRLFPSDTDGELHAGFGAMYRIEDNWGVRFDARWLVVPSTEEVGITSDHEMFVGVYKTFGTAPPVPVDDDADDDGIKDADDVCPNEPENLDGVRDEDGCPEAPPASAKDETPEPLPPMEAPTDDDGDGLAGDDDACPNEAEDKDGFQDTDGCPDPDNDGDGIADAADKCPIEAEVKNGFEDADGCPDEVPAAVAKFTGTIEGIRFRTGSAVILKSSNKVLDRAAKVLLDHPALRLKISGHTDDRGKRASNVALSQRRADAVKTYLTKKGVSADRLEAVGIGPDSPVETNDTKAGRAKNRRVDFALID